jgi:bacillolysin
MRVLICLSVSVTFAVIVFSGTTVAETNVGNGQITQRATQDMTIEVLQTNDQGKPTAITGNLGEVGMDSTYANEEAFREGVKAELTSLLQNQVGGEWLIADASKRDFEAQGKSKVSGNGYAHVRFIHQVHGYPVEGASLVAHTDAEGKIFLVNGEFLDGKPVATVPLLESHTAISLAMGEAGISQENLRMQNLRGSEDADLSMVRDENDNVCFAWKTLVDFLEIDEDGKRKQAKAILYADTQTGRLCGFHPQLYELDPDIRTYSCTARAKLEFFNSVNNMDCSHLHSDSVTPISTGEAALDAAHNYAIATFMYYKNFHGLDSLDDNGHPLVSNVLAPEFQFENAFWDGSKMTYGDGNPPPGKRFLSLFYLFFPSQSMYSSHFAFSLLEGSTYPFSLAADVVAHELVSSSSLRFLCRHPCHKPLGLKNSPIALNLSPRQTHGVTTSSANLIYSKESGAINEAMSDIFGIQVKRIVEGGSGPSLWHLGDKILASGKGIRDMSDPESRGHYSFYPTRYTGKDDNGGVHWNSGIANLAFFLFVNGGSHPRDLTSVVVKGLIEVLGDEDEAFEVAGDIFFCSLWSCLTSRSTFVDLRLCTTTVCGLTGRLRDREIMSSMEDAWDAVGVAA